MALGSIINVDSIQEWQSTLLEIEKYGICGLRLETTGEDPLSHDIKIISISLPNSVCIAETPVLGKKIICDLAGLLEQKEIKKIPQGLPQVISRRDGCRTQDR